MISKFIPRLWLKVLFILSLILFPTLIPAFPPFAAATQTIIDVLSSDSRYGNLLRALQHTRLIREVNHYEAATLFAPVNEAIDVWWDLTREQLLYHILFAELKVDELLKERLLDTRLKKVGRLGNGEEDKEPSQKVKAYEEKSEKFVGNARIIKQGENTRAANGIVHPIDAVLTLPLNMNATLHSLGDGLRLFTEYLAKQGLSKYLAEKPHLTVFAPTDDAFGLKFKIYETNYFLGECGGGLNDLEIVLKYHVLDGLIYTKNMHNNSTEPTLQGEFIEIQIYPEYIKVGDGNITQTDVLAENGVVHVINRVSAPSALHFNELKYLCGLDATIFVHWIQKAGLDHLIQDSKVPYTILAPRDSDLNENFLAPDNEKFLKYHFVEGKRNIDSLSTGLLLPTELKTRALKGNRQRTKVTKNIARKQIRFNNVLAIGDPVEIGNSIIYVLERSLNQPGDFVQTFRSHPKLKHFVNAILWTDADDIAEAKPGITVFAPIDEAFEELGLVYNYFLHPTGQDDFYSVLKFHVLDEILYTENIPQGKFQHETVEGTPLTIERQDEKIILTSQNYSSTVTERDLLIENGVVHFVDSLRIPPIIQITPLKILTALNAENMLKIFNITNFTSILAHSEEPFTILLPPEEELNKLNIKQREKDPDNLLRILGMHVIPGTIEELQDGEAFPTLLANDIKIQIKQDLFTRLYYVEIQGALSFDERAKIISIGKTSNGGAVFQIDKVLIRNSSQHLVRMGLMVLIGLGLGGFLTMGGSAGYWGWQKWKSWGYSQILDGDSNETAGEQGENLRD
ncbi:hypothetical protein G9A89_002888 [Geosiphon pyriformis]|nr:hypothetical protein G9A89_002888 [Geosiphon pyriformis]